MRRKRPPHPDNAEADHQRYLARLFARIYLDPPTMPGAERDALIGERDELLKTISDAELRKLAEDQPDNPAARQVLRALDAAAAASS